MKQSPSRRQTLLAGTALVALFLVGATIARCQISERTQREYAAFTEQSEHLALVFARAADAWLERRNPEAIDEAAGLLLAGSGLYVRITMETVVILDKRKEGFATSLPDLADSAEIGLLTELRSVLHDDGLDVMIPIQQPGKPDPDNGVVQIGFSDGQAASRVAEYRNLVLLLAGGSWLVVLLATLLVGRILALRARLPHVQGGDEEASSIVRCGKLVVDSVSCAVQLNGQPVELTPKMFELLAYLAQHPGRTFSDCELLEALWADAPYAASGDVKQCIYMLRQRLGTVHPDPKQIIVNVKGFGYRLEPPTEPTLNHD